jgi:isopentenyl phosphate kinase
MDGLTFLKLGGSLITDKDTPHTVRADVLQRILGEIAAVRQAHPELPILLGHGSGSFGHTAAKKYGTRQGVATPEAWQGFAEVWYEARALNQLVIDASHTAGLPVIAFPPSGLVTANNGQVLRWDLEPLKAALAHGLIPLVYGDTVFDEQRGGTILSTEDLFIHLAYQLRPQRILLAGIEEGVWADFPTCTTLIPSITPATFSNQSTGIGGSASVDVTGGMLEKVRCMVALAEQIADFQAMIFSGSPVGSIAQALSGNSLGTVISP